MPTNSDCSLLASSSTPSSLTILFLTSNPLGPAAEDYAGNAPAELDPARGALATESWAARVVPGTPSRGRHAAQPADCLPDSAEQAPRGAAGASPAPSPNPKCGAAHRLLPALDAAAAAASAAAGRGVSNPNPEPRNQFSCVGSAARGDAAVGDAGAAGPASAKAAAGPPASGGGKENLGPGEPGAAGAPDAPEDSDITDAGGSGGGHGKGLGGSSGGADDADSGAAAGRSGTAPLRAAAGGVQEAPAAASAPAAVPATLGFAYSEACAPDDSEGRLAGQVTKYCFVRGIDA